MRCTRANSCFQKTKRSKTVVCRTDAAYVRRGFIAWDPQKTDHDWKAGLESVEKRSKGENNVNAVLPAEQTSNRETYQVAKLRPWGSGSDCGLRLQSVSFSFILLLKSF
jgi:hypothetical protein